MSLLITEKVGQSTRTIDLRDLKIGDEPCATMDRDLLFRKLKALIPDLDPCAGRQELCVRYSRYLADAAAAAMIKEAKRSASARAAYEREIAFNSHS
jgi:hypothetical protein